MAGHLDDWIAETPESIAARLHGAQEAQRQTRFTLGLMALVSMMMAILSYNTYLSLVVFFACWIPLCGCCFAATRYSRATDTVLRDYGHRLRSDLLQREPAPTR